MALHVLAAALTFAAGVLMLLRALPPEVRSASSGYEVRAWCTSIIPLSLISGMHLINNQASILLLGLLSTNEQVGIYRVAQQAASLAAFTLSVVNIVIAPQITRLYHIGDMGRLQRMVTWSARVILAASLPVVAALTVFGSHLLRLTFGEEYVGGAVSLAILCMGQLVNAAMGSVGLLLNMTGHERDTAKAMMAAAIGNIILNLTLIPIFNIEGAAAASAVCLAGWNIYLYRQVRRRLGINSFAV
jgi:O-antigen/teichoic acid export membrane protein